MDFPGFGLSRIARSLARLESKPADLVDAFFERSEEVELLSVDGETEVRARREEGFALRLASGSKCWSSSRDQLSPDAFGAAYRQIARSMPPTPIPFSDLRFPAWSEALELEDLLELPGRLQRELRLRRVGFPLDLRVSRHRRWVQVVGTQVAPELERETFYSLLAELPGGRFGTLACSLDDLGGLANALVELFRSRGASSPEKSNTVVVLGPSAAGVFLHEAVGHSLEADVLAISGDPAQAIGLELGSELLDLLDDPAGAPEGVARRTDDEGVPVLRRWLLRRGRVEQLIADRSWAERIEGAAPGSGRRVDRHSLPAPRSAHLELLCGTTANDALLAESDGGLYLEAASRGYLDPLTGLFWIEAPWSRRIGPGGLAERLGGCRLRGRVSELLAAVTAVGDEALSGGAGWCAKAEQKVPVWATAPPLRLENVEVVPA